jgi:hypothetical protein
MRAAICRNFMSMLESNEVQSSISINYLTNMALINYTGDHDWQRRLSNDGMQCDVVGSMYWEKGMWIVGYSTTLFTEELEWG